MSNSYAYDSDDPLARGGRGDGPTSAGSARSSRDQDRKEEEEDEGESKSSSGGDGHGRKTRKAENTDDEDALDNEYYSFLNISRKATPEDVTAAYKKLSRFV